MNNVYSVGQVNRYVKNMFTQDYFLQNIYVKGEVPTVNTTPQDTSILP